MGPDCTAVIATGVPRLFDYDFKIFFIFKNLTNRGVAQNTKPSRSGNVAFKSK